MLNSGATTTGQAVQPHAPRKRILVVEDELNARTALIELLTDDEYAVEEASNAFQALEKSLTFRPDLVLTDLKMPGMDGLQLMERLRQADPELPVVVMTAFSEGEDVIRVLRSGARDCLSKPIKLRELSRVLARVLQRSPTTQR